MMAKAQEHELTLDPENPRDYLDNLLNEYRNTEHVGYLSLINTLIILYGAGGDTTANSLRWILIFLARHQGKVDLYCISYTQLLILFRCSTKML